MPNYSYNMPDYMRRNNGCGNQSQEMRSNSGQGCRMQARPQQCEERADFDSLSGMPLAMAYVPWQKWRAIYDVKKALQCGTIFEELNKPFKGIGGCCNGR